MGDRQTDDERRHAADAGGQEAEFNRALGERVRAARLEIQLTQEQLAQRLGVARGSIANLERGAQAPSAYKLVRLAGMLGRNPGDLMPQLNENISIQRHELDPMIVRDVERAMRAAAKKTAKTR